MSVSKLCCLAGGVWAGAVPWRSWWNDVVSDVLLGVLTSLWVDANGGMVLVQRLLCDAIRGALIAWYEIGTVLWIWCSVAAVLCADWDSAQLANC